MGEAQSTSRKLTRRDFLKVSGGMLAGGYALGLAGCGGGTSGGKAEITFATYELPDKQSFQELIKRYENENPEVTIKLEPVAGDIYELVDTRLAAGEAPDIFRCQYQQVGRYSSAGAVVDLSEYLPSDYSDDFAPAFWNAISYEGAPYGFPHHTDTFALFYNTDYFETLGIEPPGSLDQAWKWDEFIDVARRINEETEAQYAFAYNWQGLSAYRWMPILYQNGGQLLSDDLKSPQVNTPEGIEAIAWPQSWFEEELVPPNTAVKSEEEIENVFRTGTIGMMLTGDWLVPYLDENMKNYGWDVTYMPRNVEAASDLGGNGLLITKDSQNPDIAADFLQFISSPENMEFFCTNFTFIPTRKSLLEKNLDYKIRPEDMQLFFEQSATIPDQMAREQAIPAFSKINQSLADQLDLAFTSGQSPEKTAQNIEADIKEALSEQE